MAVLQASSASERRRLTMASDPPCATGCHSCCHRFMEITVAEAAVLVASLRASGGWARTRRAAMALADMSRDCPPDAWFKMKTRCPVLGDDGTCTAYRVRPPSCSTHFVTSDPSGCDPWSSSGQYDPADLSDLYLEAQVSIRAAVPKGGIMSMTLPMPLALLMADRVAVRTDLTFDQAMDMLAQET